MPVRTLALATLASLLLAGCATHNTPTTTTTPAVAAHPAAAHSTANPGGQPPAAALLTARSFARSYARYLIGVATPGQVADATAAVRAQLGPRIAAGQRHGPLALLAVAPKPAAGGTYVIVFADRAHKFLAAATIGQRHARWLVVGLLAPDLDTILSPTPSSPPPSAAAAQPLAAARAFLAAYVPLLYGHARVSALRALTPALHARLRAQPPRPTASLQTLRPRVATLGITRRGSGWLGKALIDDGSSTYELILPLVFQHGQWLVSDTEYPQ